MEPRPGDVWGVPSQPETFRRVIETWPDRVWYTSVLDSRACSIVEWQEWASDMQLIGRS
jgi:hypothetical protein